MRITPLHLMIALGVWVCVLMQADVVRADRGVVVSFVVEVPDDTPDGSVVHVSGSGPQLGSWSGKGLALERGDDGKYSGSVELSGGQDVAFKFTLGSWDTVEKLADGGERENRTLRVGDPLEVVARVERWHDGAPLVSTVVGDLRLHKIEGVAGIAARHVRVWLPPGYDEPANAQRRYPLLVMHDGQNLFDVVGSALGVEWSVDETATALIDAGRIEPVIVVGIDNAGGQRMREYLAQQVTIQQGESAITLGGKGDAYAAWVVERVLPRVQGNYRVKRGPKGTATGGSSLGGVIALHLVRRYPDQFGAAVAVSPALWVDPERLVDAQAKELPADARYWLDMGTREGGEDGAIKNVELARGLSERLQARGADVRWTKVEGAAHTERAWATRFGDVLLFLYGLD